MNWYKEYKTANNEEDNKRLMWLAAQFIFNIINSALSKKPQNAEVLRSSIYEIAKQNGLVDSSGWRIKFPKNINPDQNLNIKIYTQSADGNTHAEVQGDTIRLYTDAILRDPQMATQFIYGTLLHELSHIFDQQGVTPDEDIEDAKERTVRYLTNEGEMNAFSWQIAGIYSQMFPSQPFNNLKLSQLAKQYSADGRIQAYLVKFTLPDIQQKYSHIANLAQVYTIMIRKIEYYINYILQQGQNTQ